MVSINTLPVIATSIQELESPRQIDPNSILRACRENDIEALRVLIPDNQFSFFLINASIGGELALHTAVKNGHKEIAKFLIEKGALPGLNDSWGMTAFDYALTSIYSEDFLPELIGYVIKQKVDASMTMLKDPEELNKIVQVRAQIQKSVLKWGSFSLVRIVLPEIKKSPFGIQLPSFEILKGSKKMIVQANEVLDDEGNTLIHFAAANGHPAPILACLKLGINKINISNKKGQTPLHFACATESRSIGVFAVKGQCDFSKKDDKEVTPIALLGAYAHLKNPLNLNETHAFYALIFAAELALSYALPPTISKYIEKGLFWVLHFRQNWGTVNAYFDLFDKSEKPAVPLVPRLIRPPSFLGQKFFSLYRMLFLSFPLMATASYFNLPYINLTTFGHLTDVFTTMILAPMAFEGIKLAYKAKSLNPFKALRNVVVYSAYLYQKSKRPLAYMDFGYQFFKNKLNDVENMKAAKALLVQGGNFNETAYAENKEQYIRSLVNPLILKFHPDKCPECPPEKIVELNAARELLNPKSNLVEEGELVFGYSQSKLIGR